MEEFIKNNMNSINNNTHIKYFLSKKNNDNIYNYNFTLDNIKYLLNNINYNLKFNNENILSYIYKNKRLNIINNKKYFEIIQDLGTKQLSDGIISLIKNDQKELCEFEGLLNYNSIENNQIINIDINNILILEIIKKNNCEYYQINLIIPNQNIFFDKIFNIINDIKNNI